MSNSAEKHPKLIAEFIELNDIGFWTRFALAALATWRATHLLAKEDGPAGALASVRARLGESLTGELLDCFNCLSLWIAAAAALLIYTKASEFLLIWWALSGTACLLERIGHEPIIIQEVSKSQQGDTGYGMLQPAPSVAQEPNLPGSVDSENHPNNRE